MILGRSSKRSNRGHRSVNEGNMMGYCIFKSYDFSGDAMDMVAVLKDEPYLFFLDSSLYEPERGRYSFIGFDPFQVFKKSGVDALTSLKKEYAPYREKMGDVPAPFFSGIVGYLSYDLGLALENIPLKVKEGKVLPDCFFGFYDGVIVIDHFARKLHVFATGLPEKNSYSRQRRAVARVESISRKLKRSSLSGHNFTRHPAGIPQGDLSGWKSDMTKDEYFSIVKKALDHIRRGNIYQVNLAQKFTLDTKGIKGKLSALDLFHSLRQLSPSSFGAYLDGGDFQLVSSSPERFLSLNKNIVETRPMKGTRPRGKTLIDDQKYRSELLKSAKDKAELLMITDLERNDLGRVCDFGSIRVKEMRTLEAYQTVFQSTSTVEGTLRKDKDGFDLLRACFPGGSVTGCPKIRAMQIIEDLEPSRRGIYTGSLGFMSFSGNMDFNILIRTLLVEKSKISFHTGSGIVTDSTPENEYAETLIKARALRACVHENSGAQKSKNKMNRGGVRPVNA